MKMALWFLAALAVTACAHRDSTETTTDRDLVQQKEQQVAAARGEQVVSNIKFSRGQTDLTPSARAELDRAITEARRMGNIDDVTVAVWSDVEYPARNQSKVSSKQLELADKRGEKIEDYIARHNDITGLQVSVHNMGKKPSYLADMFQTADAKLKQQLVSKGVVRSTDDPTVTGQTSSALVFIKVK